MLYHDKGTVKVAEVVRYIVTFDPLVRLNAGSKLHDVSHSGKIFLRLHNCAPIFRRAQYLSGPYFIAVSVRDADFNANDEISGHVNQTSPPLYDPEVKPSKSFWAELEVGDKP
jgi:hypothetical protein